MGPSGCGKTSLLRNICGLDQPDSGSIIIDGRDVTGTPVSRRNIGMIFQELAIFPHMKVYDNIAYGLRSMRIPEGKVRDRVMELAEMLRISDLLDSYPDQISGGQRQRVALARSVAPSPSVLLLDEPMSSLDLQLRSDLRSDFKSFARETGTTMIYVTHDHREGLYMGDRTGVMFDGILEEIANPQEIFEEPKNERMARFFGYNVVTANGSTIAFYPTDFSIERTNPEISGTIESVGFEGEYDRVHVRLDDGESVQLQFQDQTKHEKLRQGMKLGIRLKRTVALQKEKTD